MTSFVADMRFTQGQRRFTVVPAIVCGVILTWALAGSRGGGPAIRSNDEEIHFASRPTTRGRVPLPTCPNGLESWPMRLREQERKVHSQTMQDGVLEAIFEHIGTTNKYYVEFGFDADSFEGSIGSNTRNLYGQGWTGLLMDGGYENASINLHKEFLTDRNIVELFDKYLVPRAPDYVSIDVDSCDIWILLQLTKAYRPRVITVEYNSNFPPGSTISWPPDCSEQWTWDHMRVMGSSLGAVFEAARDAGYVVVHVIDTTDAFLVREDLATCLEYLPQWVHENRVTNVALHKVGDNATRPHILVDYVTYRDTGGNLARAQQRAQELLEFVPLLRVG